MNIKASLLTALASPPKLSAGQKPELFLGQHYFSEPKEDSPLFFPLSGGEITADSLFSFDIRSMDCFMLLCTTEGCGKLTADSRVYTLSSSCLLLFDCRQRFRMDAAITPWKYKVLFIDTKALNYYGGLFPKDRLFLMPASPYSRPFLCLEEVLALPENGGILSSLTASNLIYNILTDYLLFSLRKDSPPSPKVPAYLEEIQALFDNDFQSNYTLDDLEEKFHISKYKICREFGAAFGISPLQYLNRRRIAIAQHLLLTSDYKIHQIGSMVGIDNTNHFIFLFKKFTAYSPGEWKQRMT